MTSALAGMYGAGPREAQALLAATGAVAHALVEGEFACVTGTGQVHATDRFFVVTAGRLDGGEDLAVAYEREGLELLRRLSGRFVFIALDRAEEKVIAATDRLGAAPFFYAAAGSKLVFGSEVRDVLALLQRTPGPDETAVVQWLATGAMDGGRTLFAGVRRLRIGHLLDFGVGSMREQPYWTPTYRGTVRGSRGELVAAVRAQAARAVGDRASSDRPDGVLLSGGLDSSTVAALLHERRPSQVRTYSAVFPGYPTIDETPLIDELTKRLQLASSRVVVRPGGLFAPAIRFLREWKLPSLSPNLAFVLPLTHAAAEDGVLALFDGEGGDETFGCDPYLIADRLAHGRFRSALGLAHALPYGEPPPPAIVRRDLREFGFKGLLPAALHRATRRARGADHYAPAWLSASAAAAFHTAGEAHEWKRLDGPRWWRHLADVLVYQRDRLGAHDLLRRQRALAGVDGEHPFLDDLALIEFVLQLPPEASFSNAASRPLLREAMAGALPDAVRLRPGKSVFTYLLQEAMYGEDRPRIGALLSAPDAEIRAYIDPEPLAREILNPPAEQQAGPALWIQWRLAMAELWLRQQKDESFAERFAAEWHIVEPEYAIERPHLTARDRH